MIRIFLILLFIGLSSFTGDDGQVGYASYYGKKFHGRRTASGEKYHNKKYTAAHRTFPFGTIVKVTHLATEKQVLVRINDRGPFVKGRIIDVSYCAAQDLGIIQAGKGKVKVEKVEGFRWLNDSIVPVLMMNEDLVPEED